MNKKFPTAYLSFCQNKTEQNQNLKLGIRDFAKRETGENYA